MARGESPAISISLLSGVFSEPVNLTIEAFELVSAPGGGRLLRLAGEWPGAAPAVTALDVSAGAHAVSLAPLPGPAASNGRWRAAWALPRDIDAEAATFSLVLADGQRGVGARLAAALEVVARVERLDAEVNSANERAAQVESAAAAERAELGSRLDAAAEEAATRESDLAEAQGRISELESLAT